MANTTDGTKRNLAEIKRLKSLEKRYRKNGYPVKANNTKARIGELQKANKDFTARQKKVAEANKKAKK